MRKHPLLKGSLSVLCAGALVASTCVPAMALGTMNSYAPPTEPTTVDQKLITVGTKNTGISADLLGLTAVTDYSANEALGTLITSNTFGLMGSGLNANANPYFANTFYNAYADTVGLQKVSTSQAAQQPGVRKPDSADTKLVAENGNLSVIMSYRPDILLGCDPNSTAVGKSIKLKNGGAAVGMSKASLATSGYTDQVKTINEMPKTSPYYKAGDESYDPYYVELATFYGDGFYNEKATTGYYSLYTTTDTEYRLAAAAAEILEQDKTRTTRYGDPMKIASKYESYIRGLQLYIMAELNTNKAAKKKVAIVQSGGADTTAKTVKLAKSTESGNVECGDASLNSGNGSNEIGYVTEALENVCENVAGYHKADGAVDGSSWTAVVDASKLADADVIVLKNAADEANVKTLLTESGVQEKDFPQIMSKFMGSGGWGPEAAMSVGNAIGFVYPEYLNPVHALAYYFTNFYHVSADSKTLANALGMNIRTISLPKGVTADITAYDEAAIDKKIQTGLYYYGQNRAAIMDQMPKLTITGNVTIPQTDPNKKPAPALKAQSITGKSTVAKSFATAKSGAYKGKLKTTKSIASLTKTFGLKSKTSKTFAKSTSYVWSKTKKKYVASKTAAGKFSVTKGGKVYIKKGLKKGTYAFKIKVTAAKSSTYKAATKYITLKVKVA
ncbi:MAG: hypothetical protein Q4D06_00765 [Coriobacteriia bacterium]|nr:hypothetical protein [Coriobacteriia bacterium]